MAIIENFDQFLSDLEKEAYNPDQERFDVLSGIKEPSFPMKDTYLIKITFESDNLLLEHDNLRSFKNSTSRILYHSASTHPPVKGHYHVYPKNGKKEIYAVNLDGTAHHQKNKGFEIPKKEAEELKALGVNIKPNRIIEYLEFSEEDHRKLLTESVNPDYVTILIEIEKQDK